MKKTTRQGTQTKTYNPHVKTNRNMLVFLSAEADSLAGACGFLLLEVSMLWYERRWRDLVDGCEEVWWWIEENAARIGAWALIGIVSLGFWFVVFCSIAKYAHAADIVSIAKQEIGHGEIGSDNHGKYVRQYLNGKEGLPWCAGFVSYCAKRSGYILSYTLRAKDYLKLGKRVSKPSAGDIVVFDRQGGGHVGIVTEVSTKHFKTIEGNVGKYPAIVKTVEYGYNANNIVGFVRLQRGIK